MIGAIQERGVTVLVGNRYLTSTQEANYRNSSPPRICVREGKTAALLLYSLLHEVGHHIRFTVKRECSMHDYRFLDAVMQREEILVDAAATLALTCIFGYKPIVVELCKRYVWFWQNGGEGIGYFDPVPRGAKVQASTDEAEILAGDIIEFLGLESGGGA